VKKVITLIVLLVAFLVVNLFSLSPSGITNLKKNPAFNTKGMGPRNWASGIQAYFDLSGGSFADIFRASALGLLEVFEISKEFNIYFMGNISNVVDNTEATDLEAKIKEIQQNSQGINLAFYPHYYKEFNSKVLQTLTIYFPLGWKLNALKDQNDTYQYLHQFNGMIGIEFGLLQGKFSKKFMTISFEGKLSKFSKKKYESIFGEQKSSMISFEITGLVPILNGCGILANYSNSKQTDSTFSLGIVIVNSR
jgi:hypothetical protein